MSAQPAWTPAARAGLIPLRPLTFGVVLGRAFVPLRRNPKLLFGFAVVVQALVLLIATAATSVMTLVLLDRVARVDPGTDDGRTVLVGSLALIALGGVAVQLVTGAIAFLVRAVVITETSREVLSEKLGISGTWRIIKPSLWRLFGYGALVVGAAVVGIGLLVGLVWLLTIGIGPLGALVLVPLIPAVAAAALWLTAKLELVLPIIVLERGHVFASIKRSWSLSRGRFWPILGTIVIITAAFGLVANLTSVATGLFGVLFGGIIAPTGQASGAAIAALVTALLLNAIPLIVLSIGTIVESSAATLLYVDARMRKEGLDLDLAAYVEKKAQGIDDQPDPYRQNIGKDLVRDFSPPPPTWGTPAPYPAGYPATSPPASGYTPAAGYPPAMPAPGAGYAPPSVGAAPAGSAIPLPPPPSTPRPEQPTQTGWQAPPT